MALASPKPREKPPTAPARRVRWIRVRDLSTGHEHDFPAGQPIPAGTEAVEGYPPNYRATQRPAKHLVDLGGKPTQPRQLGKPVGNPVGTGPTPLVTGQPGTNHEGAQP